MANDKAGFAADIKELYEDENKFRAMIDALPTAIYTIDAEGNLTHFNPAAVDFVGFVPDLKKAKWTISFKLLQPNGALIPKEESPMALAVKERKAKYGVETIAEKPNGERIWFEAYPSPIFDKEGEIVGGINMLVDITEKKLKEKAIQDNEEHFRLALGAGEIGSWEWDLQNNSVKWSENLEDLYGMRPGEFDGTFETYLGVIHPDDRKLFDKTLTQALENGSSFTIEHRVISNNNDVMWLKCKGEAFGDENEEPTKMVGTCLNITEQKRTRQLHDIHKNLLEQIAADKPLTESLLSLCSSIPDLSSGTKAVVLLLDASGKIVQEVISPDLPESFKSKIVGRPLDDRDLGTCGQAIIHSKAVDCPDIENDETFSRPWRELFLKNNMRACLSTPIVNENSEALGSFMIYFDEARKPKDWEKKLSEFTSRIIGLSLNRIRSRKALKESEERFKNTMKQSPLSMQIFNAEGRSVMVNPAWEELWDSKKEEADNYNILKDKQLEKSGLLDEIRKAFNGEVVKLPTTYYNPAEIGKKGRERWIEAYFYPLTSKDNKINEVALIHNDITDRIKTEEVLRKHEAKLESDLSDSKLLQEISLQLIEEENIEALYEKILDAAVAIMHSDFASLQIYHPENDKTGTLQLLSYRGFNEKATKFWEWVTPASKSSCGEALKTGKRIIVSDVEKSDFMKDTDDQKVYLETGIHSVQTTPLFSRNGDVMGMISTHWKEPHDPGEQSLLLFDILARQAADLIERMHAENALAKSEKTYKTLFESIEEGYCIIEVIFDEQENPIDYRFLEVNPAFEEHTGIKGSKGKRIKELIPEIDEEWIKIYGNVAKTGEPIKFEKFDKALGNRWLSLHAFRFGKPNKNKVAVLFSDITARKENEQTDALLSAIVNGSDDAIISKTLDGVITSWNPGAERLFGYTEEEILGKHITILFPEGREKEEDVIISRIKKGEKIDHYETIRIAKDGSPVDISLTISPIRDVEGKIVGASKIARDITRQKQSQKEREKLLKEIEKEQKLLSNVFQKAPSFMAILEGPDHVFAQANDYYYKIVNNRDIIGKPVKEALPELADEEFVGILDQVYKTGVPYSGKDMKVSIRKSIDSDETYDLALDFSYLPIRNSDGEVTGIFVQGIDLTERNRVKEELQALNETLEERVQERTATLLSYQDQLRALASQLSKAEEQERERLASDLHDNLGQLLAVGKMKIDLLQKEEVAGDIKDDIFDLASLLDEAIKYTRQLMTDLKPPPSLDRENLNASINWIAQKMEKHNLQVDIEDDGKFKPLNEEVLATLRQCVQELLFNVVKHSQVNKAKISISRKAKDVIISVEDKGVGFKGDVDELQPKQSGGFGLFNITERLNVLGGSLDFHSEPGKGTKVIIRAPLLQVEELDEETLVKSESYDQPGDYEYISQLNQRINVLICDDHPMMREGLRKMIEEEDDLTIVAEATNGEDAIDLSLDLKPDIIIMDVNMPGMNGIEATREIMNLVPNTKVIGLSLHDNMEVAQAMRNAGASAYLTKADVFETLVATIRGEAKALQRGAPLN